MRKLYLLILGLFCMFSNSKMFAQTISCARLTTAQNTVIQSVCLTYPIETVTYQAGGADTAIVTGLPNGVAHSWSSTTHIFAISGTPASAGIYNYTITFRGCPASNDSTESGTITVNSLPTAGILNNNGTICSGQNAIFTISGTSGAVVTYKINRGANKTTALTGGTAEVVVSGADTIQTLSLVSVTNPATGCSRAITGSSSTVTIIPLPAASISGTTSVCQDGPRPAIIFKGSNGITPYTFTYTINGGPAQTITTKGTVSSDTVFVPTNATGSFTYNLIAVSDNNSCTQSPLSSSSATINVLIKPFLTSSKTASVCDNRLFNYKAISYPSATIISWKRDFVTGISNPPQNNTTTDLISESLDNTTDQPVVVNYIFTLSNTTGCVTYDTLKVTVNPTPVINHINDYTYCKGNAVDGIFFSSKSPNASFSWTCVPSIGFGESGSGHIPAFIAGNSIADSVVATVTVSIKTGNNTCPGPDSTFTITVLPLLSLSSTKETSVCDNVPFTYTAKSSANGINFSWKRPAVSGISNPEESRLNNAMISETLHNTGSQPIVVTYYFTLSSSPLCDALDSVKVTVNPTPKINQLYDQTFCNNNNVDGINFGSVSPNPSYSWTCDPSIGFGKSGNGNIPGFTTTNTGDSAIIANIAVSITASKDNCPGSDASFKLKVLPTLDFISATDTSVCDNSDFKYIAKSSVKGIIFSWIRTDNPDIKPAPDLAHQDSVIMETLHNSTSKPVNVYYNFTLRFPDGSCSVQKTITVTVNPTPVTDFIYDTAFCNGYEVKGLKFKSTTPNAFFQWKSTKSIGFGLSGKDSIPAFTATNIGTTPIIDTVTVSIKYSSDSCQGIDRIFRITVNPSPPKPVFSWLNLHNDSICKGASNISFNINSPADNISYLWTSKPGSPDVSIRDTNNANTVISFPNPGNLSIIKAYAINTAYGGCVDSVSQVVKISNGSGIDERRIILQNPGNMLIYPDNTMNPSNGYQWGYDSLVRTTPDRAYGPPKNIEGQVYQFFIPENRFIVNNALDTTRYSYWLILQEGKCYSRVYYNGPYAKLKMAYAPPENNTVELKVIPNPNNGIFEIDLKGNIYGNVTAKMFNSLGQMVSTQNFVKNTAEVTANFNAPDLPAGLYYIVLNSSDLKKVVARFIIKH